MDKACISHWVDAWWTTPTLTDSSQSFHYQPAWIINVGLCFVFHRGSSYCCRSLCLPAGRPSFSDLATCSSSCLVIDWFTTLLLVIDLRVWCRSEDCSGRWCCWCWCWRGRSFCFWVSILSWHFHSICIALFGFDFSSFIVVLSIDVSYFRCLWSCCRKLHYWLGICWMWTIR